MENLNAVLNTPEKEPIYLKQALETVEVGQSKRFKFKFNSKMESKDLYLFVKRVDKDNYNIEMYKQLKDTDELLYVFKEGWIDIFNYELFITGEL